MKSQDSTAPESPASIISANPKFRRSIWWRPGLLAGAVYLLDQSAEVVQPGTWLLTECPLCGEPRGSIVRMEQPEPALYCMSMLHEPMSIEDALLAYGYKRQALREWCTTMLERAEDVERVRWAVHAIPQGGES